MTRVQQLNAAVDRVKAEHDKWQKDPEQTTAPSRAMLDSMMDMFECFHAGPCPVSHLRLHNAAVAFSVKFTEWDTEATGGDPQPKFWTALRELFGCRDRLKVSPPGPMRSCKSLREQKMSDPQIAFDVYGFRTSDGTTYDPESERYAGPLLTESGQLDPQKLEAEIEKPWSVIPKDWVSPRTRKALEEVGYYDESPACGKVEKTPEEYREQALKLLTGGGTVRQIADVCKMTAAEVEALADENDIPLPDFSAADDPVDPDKEREAILQAHAEGIKPDQIVNRLRGKGMNRVNLGRVKAVLQSAPATAVATK